MATHGDSTAKHGFTRGNLILVGALAVVFVAVVYWNYFRDGSDVGDSVVVEEPKPDRRTATSENGRSTADGRRASPQAAAETEPEPSVHERAERREPWPEFRLTSVIAYDPFALPVRFPQPSSLPDVDPTISAEEREAARLLAAAQQRAATLAEIRQKGVELVLRNGEEYVAKIGDREVRVGDKIGGFRVIEISLHGVTLEGVPEGEVESP